MRNFLIAPALATALAAFMAMPANADDLKAVADMMAPDGSKLGTVELVQLSDRVLIKADLGGLEPGLHGFHIHQTGACTPDFKAAGGHFNPEDKGHGYAGNGNHAGDLSNVVAHENGAVKAETFATEVTLAKGPKNSLFDEDGSAIVIHAKADSYGDSAGAGSRVACGVIKPVM